MLSQTTAKVAPISHHVFLHVRVLDLPIRARIEHQRFIEKNVSLIGERYFEMLKGFEAFY